MKRNMAWGLLLGALACGSGSESTTPPVSSGTTPAGRELVEEKPGTWKESAPPASSAEEASVHPSVTSCLGLVKESRWAEAVPPCTEAVRNAPGNREVSAALARAKQEAAAEATAKAAGAMQEATGTASEAVEGATGTASEATEGATSSLKEKGVDSIPTGLR